MPLIHSSSKAAFKTNVRNLMHEAKAGTSKHVQSRDQALAIAYDIKRRGRATGGPPPAPWFVRSEAKSLAHTGPIVSPVGGRTDHHKMSVPSGSYVVPADIVSGLGQGNSQNGHSILGKMFSGGPYGVAAPKMGGKASFPKLGKVGKADGGSVGEPTPILAAGGEFVIPPESVQQVGGGDIDHGHLILDRWILHERKKLIKTLKGLPGPARD